MTTTTLIPATTTTPDTETATKITATTNRPLVLPAVITKGWHADPMAIHKMRWHDGAEWTEHVTHFGPVPCLHCER